MRPPHLLVHALRLAEAGFQVGDNEPYTGALEGDTLMVQQEFARAAIAYQKADQIKPDRFVQLNSLAFKLENGLLKLVESLERKEMAGDWVDHLVLSPSDEAALVKAGFFADPKIKSPPGEVVLAHPRARHVRGDNRLNRRVPE